MVVTVVPTEWWRQLMPASACIHNYFITYIISEYEWMQEEAVAFYVGVADILVGYVLFQRWLVLLVVKVWLRTGLFVSYLGYLWVVLCNDSFNNCSVTRNGWLVTSESGATPKKADMDWLLIRSSSICVNGLSEITNNVRIVVLGPDVWRRQLQNIEQQFTTRLRLSELSTIP